MSQLLVAAEIIWAAGIIDGEGCIYAAKSKHRTYNLMLRVCMSHKPTIERLRKIFEVGSIYSYRPKKKNRKTMWNWAVACEDARIVLASLLPYLWTKKREASLGIALQIYKKQLRKGRRSIVEIRVQRDFYKALREQK